ncbi:MAG TPA: amidase [Alphaproteobacteria bacterium]|nr:amidase [Alphaproteobacteria bacterium]
MSNGFAYLSATELLSLYKRKAISPVEVAKALLARAASSQARINAFCLIDEAATLRQARQSERRWLKGQPVGRLDGVPVSIKDVVLTRGWPTLRGSRAVNPRQPWEEDAPSVARLREHGAVFLGKTTTPEYGWQGITESPLTGITRNPWDPSKTSGGSSGGAGAALAAGLGPLAIGSDGAGSIRIPSAFCGVVGFKANAGRVPVYPASPFGTIAHVGPMARTVADIALMLNVIAEPDARDWYGLPFDGTDFARGLGAGIKGLRIAFSANLGYTVVDAEVATYVRQAVRVLAELGARVEHMDPGFSNPHDLILVNWFVGAHRLVSQYTPARQRRMDPGLLAIARKGKGIPLAPYLDAQEQRAALGRHMRAFHERYDLLVTPTMPIAAFPVGESAPRRPGSKKGRWLDWSPFTYPFNLTSQPAISVPCGLTRAGLPVALQIVGANYREALVLRAAYAFEQTSGRLPVPPGWS